MTAEKNNCNGGSKLEVEQKLGFESRSEVEENGVEIGVGDGKLGESNGLVVVNGGSECVKEEGEADLDQKVEAASGNGVVEGFVDQDEENSVNMGSGSPLEAADKAVEEVKEGNGELSLENGSEQEEGSVTTQNLGNVGSETTVEPLEEGVVNGREVDEVKEENGELNLENLEVPVDQPKEAESLDNAIEENMGSHSPSDIGKNENGGIDNIREIEVEGHGETHDEGEFKAQNDVGLLVDSGNQEAVAETSEVELTEDQENGATAKEASHEAAPESVDEVEEKPDTQRSVVQTSDVNVTKNQENGIEVNDTSREPATELVNGVEERTEAPTAQTDSLAVGCDLDDDEREKWSSSGTGSNLLEEPKSFSQEDEQEEVLAVGKETDHHQESVLAEDVDDLQVSETAISDIRDSVGRKAAIVLENQNSDHEEELKPTLSVEKEQEQVLQEPDSVASSEQETELASTTELQLENETCILKNSGQAEPESAAIMEMQQEPQASILENSEQAGLESAINVDEQPGQTELESAADVPEEQKLQSTVVETQSSESSMCSHSSLNSETGAHNNMGTDGTGGVEASNEINLSKALDSSKPQRSHENGSCIIAEKSSEIIVANESAECVNEPSGLKIAGPSNLCSSAIAVFDSNQSDNINCTDTESSVKIEVENGTFDNPNRSYGHKSNKDLDVKCISNDEGISTSNMVANHLTAVTCEPVTETEFVKCDEVECVTESMEEDQVVDKKEMRDLTEPVTEIETQAIEEIGAEHPELIEIEHLEDIEAKQVENVEDKNVQEIETGQAGDIKAGHIEDIKAEHLEGTKAEYVKDVEPQRVAAIEVEHQEEMELKPSDELQAGTADLISKVSDGEKADVPVVKRQPLMIKIPRLNDDLWKKTENVKLEIEDKTQARDSINILMQKQKITCIEYQKKYKAAQEEEVAARDVFRSTREKLEPIQSKLSKLKNAHSLEELDNKIQSMDYALQHETMPLKEEKKCLHDLTLLRQQRAQLSSTMGPKVELDEAFAKKEQYNEEMKALMKELDSLRANMLRAESNTKAAWKRYNDEQKLLNDLRKQFEAANDARQKSYEHLRNLKNESFEKNKYFYMYKNDKIAAQQNFSQSGDFKEFLLRCSNQVEKVMEIWNNNEQFRKSYVEYNKNSTLRRLKTLDGRSLGPDEEPPLLQNDRINFPNLPSSKKTNIAAPPTPEAKHELPEEKSSIPALQPSQKSKPTKTKNSTKHISEDLKETSRSIYVDVEQVELAANASKLSKEEEEEVRKVEELAKKEEELRKEKAAAELKEKQRLEQRIKAKEAEERKKRKAEKDQARAEQRAKKEAEFKEKKQAKKDKKKVLADKDSTNDEDVVSSPGNNSTPSETPRVLESLVHAPSKRPSRPLAAAKQYTKVQPVPLPLRNRAKRKSRTWMWVILSTLVVLILFLAGNYVSFNLPQFSS